MARPALLLCLLACAAARPAVAAASATDLCGAGAGAACGEDEIEQLEAMEAEQLRTELLQTSQSLMGAQLVQPRGRGQPLDMPLPPGSSLSLLASRKPAA
mmetsp:Transcript_81250/g.220161  ORF Transcript_81250/g.220161 Transcript_81250/m.220161 type:complete len:100 (+) Transcript_81250:40-339(+)